MIKAHFNISLIAYYIYLRKYTKDKGDELVYPEDKNIKGLNKIS